DRQLAQGSLQAEAEDGVTISPARPGRSVTQRYAQRLQSPRTGQRCCLPALQSTTAAHRLQLTVLETDVQKWIGIVDRDESKVALRRDPFPGRGGIAENRVDRRPLGGADRPAGRMGEECLVTDAEQVQDGGAQVLWLHAARGRVTTNLVAGAVDLSAADT